MVNTDPSVFDPSYLQGAVTSEYLKDWTPILNTLKITCERLEIYPEVAFSCTGEELKHLIQVGESLAHSNDPILGCQAGPVVLYRGYSGGILPSTCF